MPKRRAAAAVNYAEDAMAAAFDIGDRRAGKAKKKKQRRAAAATTTAEKERRAAGKQAYRGGAPNKPGPQAAVTRPEDPSRVPTRNKHNELVFADFPDFRPNLTPAEVLALGSFGGTYFRPITSAVTGEAYKSKEVLSEFPKGWFAGLDLKTQVTSRTYDKGVNRYGVKCGGSLDMWEGSGWISPIDPYGWFQWYCRFYRGRRSTDDERQIKRGLGVCGVKGRFRNQLIGKCARGGKAFDDVSVSPVIRQALQHWGYQLTSRDADKYVKLKKLPALPRSTTASTAAAAASSAPGAKNARKKKKKATASKN